MGLLDALQGFGNNPAAVQGLLATGLGMLAANRGGVTTGQAIGQGGLLGMNAYANAQAAQQKAAQDAMQQQLWQQQIESGKVDEQTKQLALAQARQRMGFINQLLGGGTLGDTGTTGDTGAAPAPAADVGGVPLGGTGDTSGAAATSGTAPGVPPILAAPAGAAAPAAPDAGAGIGGATAAALNAPIAAQAAAQPAVAAAQQVGAPQHVTAAASMIPPQLQKAAAADLMFNDGKNMGTMLKPNISMQSNGALLDQSTGQIVGWAPVVDTGTGRAYMMQNGPDGKPALLPVAGSAENQRSSEQIKADVASGHALREVENKQTGVKSLATEAEIIANPDLRATGRSPEVVQALQLGNTDFMTNSYRPALTAGASAQGDLDQIQAMRNIDPKTGWGAEAKGKAAAILGALGSKNAEEYASSQQQFNNVALTKLQQNLMEQKGPQTEGDAQRAAKTFTNLGNTPEANAFILDYAQAVAELKQRRAAFYQDALPLAQRSGDLAEIDRRWRKIQGSIWDNPAMSKWAPKKEGQ